MIKYLLGILLSSTQVYSQTFFLSTSKPAQAASVTPIESILNDFNTGTGTNQFNYVGASWFGATKSDQYNGDFHASNNPGDYVEVAISGYQFQVKSETYDNKGQTTILIDGAAPVSGATFYDSYASSGLPQQTLYTSPVLSNGPHVIRLTVSATKNASSSDYYTHVDAIRVLSTSGTVGPALPSGNYYVGQQVAGASDAISGTSAATPFLTLAKAASVAVSGQKIIVLPGTYRETVPSPSGVTWQASAQGTVIISGLNTVVGSWSNSGTANANIYKTTVSLPAANNFNEYIGGSGYNGQDNTSNTQLLANQVFKDGVMMPIAQWPKMYTPEDHLNKNLWRKTSQTSSWGDNSITDSGLGALGISNWTGAWMCMNGWFMTQTRQASSGTGSIVNWAQATTGPGPRFRQFYYITNHLGLLTTAKEWHYEGGVLYFWQNGGGSPTGVEYKARNWGFNLKDKTDVSILGFTFIGCDPVHGNTGTSNVTVDNIRATYMNHAMIAANVGPGGNTRNASQSGTKLIGTNNLIKNSEFKYASSMGIWLGQGSKAENNKLEVITYDGSWGAPFRPWENYDNITITKNTTRYSGRGSIEMSGDVERNNTNLRFSYNDFSKFNALSIDGGAVYTQLWSNHDGSRIDHNWFHDSGMLDYNPSGDQEGIQTNAVYFDQGSGASPEGTITMDHNVSWNTPEAHYYTQTGFEGRNGGHKNYYNNTNVGQGNGNYGTQNAAWVTYDASTYPSRQRNNINNGPIINQNNALDNSNSINQGTNAQFVGGDPNVIGGLAYRISSTSPARNFGATIVGYTDGFLESAPDAGAYEFGDPNPWTAGYTAVVYTPPSTGGGGGGGSVVTSGNIASLPTVAAINVPYNTAFGTNGVTVGLPATVTATFDGGGTGSVSMTWAIGSYLATGSATATAPGFYNNTTYTIVGTPVTGGGITNSGSLTKSVSVTVQNAFTPLASSVGVVYDPSLLVNNSTTPAGVVASGSISSLKSIAPGPTGVDLTTQGTAPTLASGRIVLTSAGSFIQPTANTTFLDMSYKATATDLKNTMIFAGNFTDNNTTNSGIFGDNGRFNGNNGIGVGYNSSGATNYLDVYLTGNGTEAIDYNFNNAITYGSDNIITLQIDNSQANPDKAKVWRGITSITQTANSGTGVLDNVPATDKWTLGDEGSFGSIDMAGNLRIFIWLKGLESSGVLTKFQQDVNAYTGISL